MGLDTAQQRHKRGPAVGDTCSGT